MENFEKLKFSSPQEELSYLREYVANKEKELGGTEGKIESEERVKETIEEYRRNSPEDVMEKGVVIPEKIRDEIVLELSPEEHDTQISELINIVNEKGVINALDIVMKMDDAHLTDDLHRFLVQYIKAGYYPKNFNEKTPLAKNLKRTLFEVTLNYDRSNELDLQQFVNLMEQFYSGMLSVTSIDKNEYITIEIANPIGSQEFIFYISVPDSKVNLLEKQLLSVFPGASMIEQKDDFNIFNSSGESVGVYAIQEKKAPLMIKDYSQFTNDPMRVLLNVFSKLDKNTEAAGIQMIFKPVGDFYVNKYQKGLRKIESGASYADEFHARNTLGNKLVSGVGNIISGGGNKSEDKEQIEIDHNLVEQVKNKIKNTVVSTNFRVAVSTSDRKRSEDLLQDIESAFNQFENTEGNKFKFVSLNKKGMKKFLKEFSFREFNPAYDAPLNLSEVSTVIHFPITGSEVSPELKTNRMKTSGAPVSIASEGIHLGRNTHRGYSNDIYLSPEDRLRHFYVIGQTGTGKTNILKNMIIQDINNGEGVCMIDPHGSDIQDVLANIPENRYEDVIYFDPSNVERPMALNMLEYDQDNPQQKTFVVNELFNIFQKLYGDNPESMGPMFEQYFRNATMLVIDDPDSGSTLLDVSRVLSDRNFRNKKIANCKNPIVIQFWKEIATQAGGESALENIVPYITSKFDIFLANDIMRPIVSQQKSSFDFREIMDQKKILLVNLSKGSLGDINSNLIGLIVVGKILMAALSRSDDINRNYPPFYLYIDEFQNVTTDSISTILSEARKYKLSLNIAHQFIAQLEQKIKDSVFGNVGSIATFRVGSEDAEFLAKQYEPVFSYSDIMNIDNFNAYLKILSNGIPVNPFSINVPKAPDGNKDKIEYIKKLSSLKYGRDREEVDSEILKKYEKEENTFSRFKI